MKKLLLLSLIFGLFFIGCGNTNANSNEKENEKAVLKQHSKS